jgi:hypothetical protein
VAYKPEEHGRRDLPLIAEEKGTQRLRTAELAAERAAELEAGLERARREGIAEGLRDADKVVVLIRARLTTLERGGAGKPHPARAVF